MAGGFITIHRQLLNWGWYKNTNTKAVFLHLLLKANYKALVFEGRRVERGQLVTSLPSLASELGMTIRQVRGSLEHLISTGEVTSKAYPRYRIITIVKYNDYQDDDRQNGRQTSDETAGERQADDSQTAGWRQADDRLMTGEPAVSKQYKQRNNSNKGTMEQGRERTASRFTPPTRDEVEVFCLENGLMIDVDRFIDHYSANGWMVGKNHMKDWQATVRNWARRDSSEKNVPVRQAPVKTVTAQRYEQRDYSDVDAQVRSDMDREMEEWLRSRGGA